MSQKRAEGLYLVAPHGRLIFEGDGKRAVAKPTFEPGSGLHDLRGEWTVVSKEGGQGFAFGRATLGEPEEVEPGEFDARYGEHRVSREDRLRWWPDARTLWLYPVEKAEPYPRPVKVEVPPGVQTRMREVVPEEKSRAEALLEKLSGLPDRFVWVPDFVSLTGSQIYAAKDREPNDADVVLRAEEAAGAYELRLPVDAAFALKLERVLRDALGTGKVQYVGNPYGPNWHHLPLYDLCLVRKPELAYREMNEPQFARTMYKARTLSRAHLDRALRGASDEVKRQARETYERDEVKPGRMVLSLKPLRPAPQGERQVVSHFYDYIEENLEFPLFLSAKRDGATHYAHGDGEGRVWLFSDDGEDNTERLPNLAEAFREKFKGKSFVLGVEIEKWKGGNHYPREAAIGDVKKGEDGDLAVNVFRAVYWDGRDLHTEPFSEVWEVMQKIPADSRSDGKLWPRRDGPVNVVPHYEVKSMAELRERLASVAYKPGVEGVVVKRADGTFPLDGEPGARNPTEIKWHKSVEVSVLTLGREETKTSNIYVYWFGIPI